MTLQLEIAPDVKAALEAKAQRAGVPLKAYAARVLAREAGRGAAGGNGSSHNAQSDLHEYSADELAAMEAGEFEAPLNGNREQPQATGAAFLALADELMPIIKAGTLRPLGSVDVSELLDAARNERDAELDAALMGARL
jgi:hypothetical protein